MPRPVACRSDVLGLRAQIDLRYRRETIDNTGKLGEFIFQASWSKHSATVALSWEKWNCFTNLSLLQRLNDAVTSCSSSANTCTQANTVDLPESKNHVVSYPGIEVHW